VQAVSRLKEGGRLAVISFHEGEDRIVKNYFREQANLGRGTLLHKKPLTPNEDEIYNNHRARSAKLRIFIKN
jgi:16S rRNA (cytosine1402-N4)-methyltransferase